MAVDTAQSSSRKEESKRNEWESMRGQGRFISLLSRRNVCTLYINGNDWMKKGMFDDGEETKEMAQLWSQLSALSSSLQFSFGAFSLGTNFLLGVTLPYHQYKWPEQGCFIA